ncbi:helix-turn-helix domain-containing protein [Dongia sp.]|uniref:helix-turn-helix domain-containing protein n=1 Tax=Dongia sp. TaxID=1977262 RepID=UPI0035B30032
MASRKVGMFGVEPNEFIDDRNEDGVAALLRRRREELGRDVATVARQLRIRAVYISAIEEGRLQDLPGTAYAVGFVRAYADYLGLDGNSVVGDYRDELARRSRQNQLIWPVDQVEHKHFPGGIVLLVSLVILGALYGGWYMASRPGGTGIELIDQVPEFMKKQTTDGSTEGAVPADGGQSDTASQASSTPSSAQASQAPAPAAAANPVPATPAASAAAPVADETASAAAQTSAGEAPVDEVSATSEATAAAAIAAATPLPAAAPGSEPVASAVQAAAAEAPVVGTPVVNQLAENQTAALPAASAAAEAEVTAASAAAPGKRIVLRATKDSWVEIFDANEEIVLQRILRAGETFAVPDQPGLTMNTGNAGGVVIELDGKARPALGSVGVVKRGVKLDPAVLDGQ